MHSVEEALRLVLDHAQPLGAQPTDLLHALGRVLAEPVVSDIDSPPHDKSIVDGYAVIAADVRREHTELTFLEEITAGKVPTQTVQRGACSRIMTGAPIPAGANAVVMVEQTRLAGERVVILQSPIRPGQNIMRRAASLARGQELLRPGKVLRAIELGLLAEVGHSTIATLPRPRVAIIATGNELVPAEMTPGPGQIRNSNEPLLAGLVAQAGGDGVPLGICRDEPSALKSAIQRGLDCDVLLLSGGVSAGVLDLVPQVLGELGVDQVFHKVNLKPGKPLWFGIQGRTLVFGLPGNPVSGLVCFELFVRPAIEKLSGKVPKGLSQVTAVLTQEHKQRGDRPTYWPAVLDANTQPPQVTPLPWQGSGDLRTLTDANALAYFPAGERTFRAGDETTVLVVPEP